MQRVRFSNPPLKVCKHFSKSASRLPRTTLLEARKLRQRHHGRLFACGFVLFCNKSDDWMALLAGASFWSFWQALMPPDALQATTTEVGSSSPSF